MIYKEHLEVVVVTGMSIIFKVIFVKFFELSKVQILKNGINGCELVINCLIVVQEYTSLYSQLHSVTTRRKQTYSIRNKHFIIKITLVS